MCGFVGFTNKINNSNKVIEQMADRIRHRGPDSGGFHIDGDVALGFRRLSIIDLSGGDQPIYNEDKTKILLFNGEIYNYQKLRGELIKCGHVFQTNSDSETLLHGYEQWGADLLNKLRGMFAFVIWDTEKKEFFGARDFFGIKPLYFANMPSDDKTDVTFMFGSEIKSFLPHPAFKKEFYGAALPRYLSFQYNPDDYFASENGASRTFFKNVYKLPPAHYFLYKDGAVSIKRYWGIKFDEQEKTFDEYVKLISETFKDSVSAHKIADVEVGSFLSSGIDSSYVAAVADVDKTFTVGFQTPDGTKYNEISYAKDFSGFIGKENFSKEITPEEYWETFPKIQYHMDEPLADPSAAALYFVSKLASEQVKVTLSGEGADELFGGYNVYSSIDSTAYDKLPFGVRRGISKTAAKLPARRGRNFFVRHGMKPEDYFIGNANIFTPSEAAEILKSGEIPDTRAITKPFYERSKENDDITKMQYIDLHLWMVGDILLKADKMSMANSLEVRVPFLDKEVMALAQKIPSKYRVTRQEKMDGDTPYVTKYALRKAALDACPPFVAGKKKLGFPVPTRVWLKEEKYYNIIKNAFESETSAKFFNAEQLMKLLNEHKNGAKDNSRKIWTVYTFLVWYGVYFNL